MSNLAIKVEGLGKQYSIGRRQNRYKTLRDTLTQAGTSFFKRNGHRQPDDEIIWALRDISFEVRHGEVVGVIGRNGAGKSTLLKVLSRITEPTKGYVDVYGRVGSLLEVGTGFHPELTGRENIYLNGAILGMKRAEIEKKFDEIVAFAEVEKFIETPVKHYSSGMYLRLAFAVAAHLEPEILLVDEVLAVGDADFQRKCLGKMGEVAKEGRTVVFVSHNMAAVGTLCHWGLLIDKGQIENRGPVSDVIADYLVRLTNRSAGRVAVADADKRGFQLTREADEIQFTCGDRIKFSFEVACPMPVRNATAGMILYDIFENPVVGTSSKFQKIHGNSDGRRWQVGCDMGTIPLNSGRYYVSIWFGNEYRDFASFSKAFSLTIAPADPFDFGNQVPPAWGHFYWKTGWEISALDRD